MIPRVGWEKKSFSLVSLALYYVLCALEGLSWS